MAELNNEILDPIGDQLTLPVQHSNPLKRDLDASKEDLKSAIKNENLTEQEVGIFESINVASENDPNNPEFPPEAPCFPASLTKKIDIPGFGEIYIKDESTNPTGTHKDRMAWEIAVTYKSFLWAKMHGHINKPLPQMSLISSGSAAIAIQSRLKKHGLPNLKVLVDNNTDPSTVEKIKELGGEVYQTDLSQKSLDADDILEATENPQGIDITSSDALEPGTRYYDWLSYEIVNEKPDIVFIPYGTGHLFENTLNVNKREIGTKLHDPRFRGDLTRMRKCSFFGATTNNADSKATKLYSPNLPFSRINDQWLRVFKLSGSCGIDSGIICFEEKYLEQAMQIASSQNLKCEPSGISGLALFLKFLNESPELIGKDKKILIVNTGCMKG